MTAPRTRGALALFLTLSAAACQGSGPAEPTPSAGGVASPAGSSAPSPGSTASSPEGTTPLVEVPSGRILYFREGPDGALHYFTVNSDGTGEQELAPIGDCAPCVRWSPDGARVWTMGATDHGTFSFATVLPDGSDLDVISPPIETLNLGPGTPSVDGEWIAFDSWDETDPSRNGVYLGSPDLTDLRRVTPLPEGTVRTEPFGVTPDGSQVLFFADRGQTEHAEGDLYVVNADGTGLRQLNPPGTTHNFSDVAPGSLSPDGRQVAFPVADAVFVADVGGGEPRQITERTGFAWAVSWSPTGEWIVYTRQHGTRSVISLVRPDGTENKEISATDGSDEAAGAVWSPNGEALLVLRRADAGDDLWIMDLGGNYIGQVTDEPSTYGSYSWASSP